MKTITRNYFECKIKHLATTESGAEKKVSSLYVVDAATYTDAEAKLAQEMNQYYNDWGVVYIKPAKFKEIAFMNDVEKVLQGETDKLLKAAKEGKGSEQLDAPIDWNSNNVDTSFYRATIDFITLGEKSMKEKRTKYIMLVEGTSLHNAVENIEEAFKGSVVDYDSVLISKTKIADIFLYKE